MTILAVATLACLPFSRQAPISAQQAPGKIPVPSAVRAAIAAGTRDPSGRPGPEYWQIRPKYRLHARLDTATATIFGSGTVSLRNTSPDPIKELVLRLDQNRFRKPSRGGLPTTGISVRKLVLRRVEGAFGRAVPDSEVTGLESTVARISLQEPLPPENSIELEIEWHFEVPLDETGLALRQGRWGKSLFQVAQWYPRLAMFDDLGGWDLAEHEGSLEFHNPFSDFDVDLTLPSGWLVGSTGTLTNPDAVLSPRTRGRLTLASQQDTSLFVVLPEERGEGTLGTSTGELTWRFHAESVRDFTWGVSRDYAWSITSKTLPAKNRLLVHSFMTLQHEGDLSLAGPQAAEAIGMMSERVMPYPWDQHTLLDGPEGGMEYPMVTLSHGGIIRHETAHQWFPMMVGTDETRFAFLDEGFASFFAGAFEDSPRGRSRERETLEPILLPDDVRTPRPAAALYGYGRGARMLRALAERVGEDRLVQAISDDASDWRFKHPTPWDFMASMERSLHLDLSAFWTLWLFSTEAIEGSRGR